MVLGRVIPFDAHKGLKHEIGNMNYEVENIPFSGYLGGVGFRHGVGFHRQGSKNGIGNVENAGGFPKGADPPGTRPKQHGKNLIDGNKLRIEMKVRGRSTNGTIGKHFMMSGLDNTPSAISTNAGFSAYGA